MTVLHDTRIRVHVHAADPISRAGAASHLRHHRELDLVDEWTATDTPAAVTVLITESADARAVVMLRRLTCGEKSRVVLVVERMDEAELLATVECGVTVILRREEATATRLARAVLAAARGDGDMPADLLGRLINRMGRHRRGMPDPPGATPLALSERETEVLRLVAGGCDTAEIATRLAFSERTVKNVLHGMTTRLHLRNRAHAVAYALREGYI
ncbi:LuxR C-terminal-related transcriptional regulator [Streptomyces sp. NPDC046261]|uniref:helix-turn-helix transcriptional regulator n=1 Tax=Streptomyces sp. NPDC046261 TaxID=3157200 RepID=UPI0033EE8AD7